MELELRKTTLEDLPTLFAFQAEEAGIQLAAFTAPNPHDREAYMTKWSAIVQNPEVVMRTLLADRQIVGSVVQFVMFDQAHVAYWIGRAWWGRGWATEGLRRFLPSVSRWPLHARVACDNRPSQRVLEKCGFVRVGSEIGFAPARAREIEEFIYRLDTSPPA